MALSLSRVFDDQYAVGSSIVGSIESEVSETTVYGFRWKDEYDFWEFYVFRLMHVKHSNLDVFFRTKMRKTFRFDNNRQKFGFSVIARIPIWTVVRKRSGMFAEFAIIIYRWLAGDYKTSEKRNTVN